MGYRVGGSWEECRAIAQWLKERGDVYDDGEAKRHLLHRASEIVMGGVLDGSLDSFVSMGRRWVIAEELEEALKLGLYERGPDTEAIAEAIRELTDTTFGSDVANPYE